MAAKTIDIRGILTKNLSVTALFMALILGGIIMAVCGYNPFEAYGAILEGAFAGKKAICQTLVQATPLIFAGLAYTVAKRANLINLGIEGQLYIGALGTSVIALMPLNLPMGVWLPLALAAAVAGIVIWTFSLLAAFENVQVLFQEEGEVYRFEAAGYEYEFSGNDIQSVKLIDELPDERFTRTNGGSTEKVNIGHFRGRETGKCMMFLYNDCTPVLEIRLDDMTVFANSRDPQETERWLDMLSE